MTRRDFARLVGAVGAVAALARPARAGAQGVDLGDGFVVQPRSAWAGALAATGALLPEDEVKFLLVHHTVSSNTYGPADVPSLLQSVYGLHTGPEKGWPDVAYNFFVDRFGGVWEGRTGSLAGAVQPDATGGSQGFAQLCCFIGDHSSEPPTTDARDAMVHLLALLGERYEIDTTPGVTVEFVSRGSNRWPSGAPVVATTIAGHRDMSQTACPGDAAYPLVQGEFPQAVTALRLRRAAASAAATTVVPTSAGTATTVGGQATIGSLALGDEPDDRSTPGGFGFERVFLASAGLVGVVLGGVIALRRRRSQT